MKIFKQTSKQTARSNIALWIILIVMTIPGAISQALAVKPSTIPAIQEWTDGSGSFNFSPSSRIVLDQATASYLATTGQVFQSDLFALTGMTHQIVIGTQSSLAAGDIFLSLGAADPGLGTEGYKMIITDRIVISAQADTGVFYGTRTLLQLLAQHNTISAGSARDYPRYPLRSLHVDNGRKFLTVGWLENHIKELAYFKMNLFHWHLAEWNFFRLQSSSHPEIVASQYYTKAQVQEMLALAARYHVIIMPEIEMPGHMNWALRVHPELTIADSTGYVNPDDIDLTNPASYTLVSDLLNEFLPLFPGPYFHIGTDEYISDYSKYPTYTTYAHTNYGANANAKDVYFHFINWADAIVRSYGKTTWAWDDQKTGGSVFTINKDIDLDSWIYTGPGEISSGFTVNNTSGSALYYLWYTTWEPMQTQLYEQWAPNQWYYNNPGPVPPYSPGLLGAKLALWFDNNNFQEYSMAWDMHYAMRTVAQQTWASPKIVLHYTDFKTLSDQLGHAPGTTFPPSGDDVAFGKTTKASTEYSASYAANMATDSDPINTRWCASNGTNGQWLMVDLGFVYNINGTEIKWESNGVWQYKVETSNDAVTWHLAVDKTTNNTPAQVYDNAFSAQGRYVRVTSTTNQPGHWASIYDFQVFAIPQNKNLAQNKSTQASSSYNSSYSASRATDYDPTTTRWCAVDGSNGQWLMVDLGAVYNLTGTEVKWESNGVWRYKVEVSKDGVQWVLAIDKRTNTAPAQVYDDAFSMGGRYVRITATTNQPGHWASIYDFKVFG
jgi:hexosaminidase